MSKLFRNLGLVLAASSVDALKMNKELKSSGTGYTGGVDSLHVSEKEKIVAKVLNHEEESHKMQQRWVGNVTDKKNWTCYLMLLTEGCEVYEKIEAHCPGRFGEVLVFLLLLAVYSFAARYGANACCGFTPEGGQSSHWCIRFMKKMWWFTGIATCIDLSFCKGSAAARMAAIKDVVNAENEEQQNKAMQELQKHNRNSLFAILECIGFCAWCCVGGSKLYEEQGNEGDAVFSKKQGGLFCGYKFNAI